MTCARSNWFPPKGARAANLALAQGGQNCAQPGWRMLRPWVGRREDHPAPTAIGWRLPYISVRHNHSTGPYR